jgi:hypothetical protein
MHTIRVHTKGVDHAPPLPSRVRGGFRFTPQFGRAEVTDEELAQIQADPMLHVCLEGAETAPPLVRVEEMAAQHAAESSKDARLAVAEGRAKDLDEQVRTLRADLAHVKAQLANAEERLGYAKAHEAALVERHARDLQDLARQGRDKDLEIATLKGQLVYARAS